MIRWIIFPANGSTALLISARWTAIAGVSHDGMTKLAPLPFPGQIAPKKAEPRRPDWHAWADWLLEKLAARPDIYLRELQAELKQEHGIEVCLTTICNACHALGQSRKKRC